MRASSSVGARPNRKAGGRGVPWKRGGRASADLQTGREPRAARPTPLGCRAAEAREQLPGPADIARSLRVGFAQLGGAWLPAFWAAARRRRVVGVRASHPQDAAREQGSEGAGVVGVPLPSGVWWVCVSRTRRMPPGSQGARAPGSRGAGEQGSRGAGAQACRRAARRRRVAGSRASHPQDAAGEQGRHCRQGAGWSGHGVSARAAARGVR